MQLKVLLCNVHSLGKIVSLNMTESYHWFLIPCSAPVSGRLAEIIGINM